MWYLITFGSGLLIGVGFLIWALRERSLRHKAEAGWQTARQVNGMLRRDLLNAATTIDKQRRQCDAVDKQVEVLHATVAALREKLRVCRDPETVRAWLDEELKKQV